MQNKYLKIPIILALAVFFGFSNSVFSSDDSTRIISLAPATTEILFALGLDEEIIAVSESCNYPEAAKAKQKTGTFSQPNIERILSLKPDIVFCTGLEQASVAAKLKKLKVNVFVSDPKNIGELFKSIREMGRLTNREEEALKLVEGMEERMEKVKKQS
ncbi:MAG: helical backbone metal receptor, partial [Candidatus Omnitrophica bacterium]|nr:helical backbone metal receptor [Candidatus Omnitrophota bacterium]